MSPRAARTFLVLTTVVWLIAVLLACASFFELSDLFGPLALLLISGPLIVLGIGISIVAIVKLRFPACRRVALQVLALMAVVAFLTTFTQFSARLSLYARLWRCERMYQVQIQSITAGVAPSNLGSCGMLPVVDSGPPRRIGVPWIEVAEHWAGVVYDPSGTIPGLAGHHGSGTPGGKPIFESSLDGAAHVWGPWYYCWFEQGGIAGHDVGELFGSWRLISDDDAYRRPIPSEVITFSRDGKVSIKVDWGSFGGSYRIEGREIVLSFGTQGNTRVSRLLFKLNKAGLHFANPVRGFAHYVRVKS